MRARRQKFFVVADMLRSFLGTGLLRRLPAATWGARGIITVKVNDPSTRGDERSKDVMQGEVMRAEEMAVAHFNRLVRKETELGSLHQSGRRMKRLSRYVKPFQQRRLDGAPSPTAARAPGR